MIKPPILANEAERLDRLYRLNILDTAPEDLFDDITRLAAMFLETTFATITLVDRDRQWFKSRSGPLELTQTPRETSFCGHALLENEVFVIEDALKDERFHDNPFVIAGPMIRFYAGAPLVTSDGLALGTLCVFDPQPRQMDDSKREALTLLANQVTDRLEKRLQHTLVSLLGRILDSSDLYVLMLDIENNFVNYSNQAFKKRAGDAELSAEHFFARLFPELDSRQFLKKGPATEEIQEHFVQSRVQFSSHDSVQADLRLTRLTESGRSILLVLFQDKSALQASENEVKKTRSNLHLFNQLAVQSKNLIVITNEQQRIEWVNPSFEKQTGYKLDEVAGKVPGSFLQGPDTCQEARARIGRHLREGRPVVQEILNYNRNGEPYWLEVYIEPIRDEQGTVTQFISSQVDITNRKQQEQAVRESRDAAERANRAKSEFLTSISHELRTPLNGIIGVAELLKEEVDAAFSGYIGTLDTSSQHLLRILNDLLDLSHIESGNFRLRPESFAVMSILSETEQLFTPLAEAAGISITLETEGLDDLVVLGDATRLKQVVMNLVSNAIQFTDQGGVTLSAKAWPAGAGEQNLAIAITDTGPGIPFAEQERIFGHFEQLDNSTTRTQGGSGLGLAISQQLVRLMGGEIELESVPGQGAQFRFTLSLPASGQAPLLRQTLPAASLFKLGMVLVVDDNEINRRVLSSMLTRLGAGKVHAAPSARSALALLENIHFDILLVDIRMPEISGYAFLERARAMLTDAGRPIPPMVACTADISPSQSRDVLDAGFDAHLGKPVTGQALAKMLKSLAFDVKAGPRDTSAAEDYPGDADAESHTIDLNSLQEAFDNSPELMMEFLRLFRDNHRVHLDRVETALAEGGLPGSADAAHTLKGLLGYFGRNELPDLAQQLQTALKDDRRETAVRLHKQLKWNIDELLDALDEAIDSR
jgi:PAS domain S-box-containing protein